MERLESPYLDTDHLKRWVSGCELEHNESCQSASVALPSHVRMIDTYRKCIMDTPVDCHYVALSYVWQNTSVEADIRLKTSNDAQLT